MLDREKANKKMGKNYTIVPAPLGIKLNTSNIPHHNKTLNTKRASITAHGIFAPEWQ